MSEEMKSRFARLKVKLYRAKDALHRADEDLHEENFEKGRLDYVQDQLLKANVEIIDAVQVLNGILSVAEGDAVVSK